MGLLLALLHDGVWRGLCLSSDGLIYWNRCDN